jgi:hypothetical protein
MYDHCSSQATWSDHNIFDLTSNHFDSYCMSLIYIYIYIYHHEWSPPLLTFCHHTHAPACHCLPLVSPEHSDDGKEESGALNGSEHISQEPHYIHDDVSIMPNTEEEEQNEKENVEARSEIILLSPTEGGLQVLKHRDITLWFH